MTRYISEQRPFSELLSSRSISEINLHHYHKTIFLSILYYCTPLSVIKFVFVFLLHGVFNLCQHFEISYSNMTRYISEQRPFSELLTSRSISEINLHHYHKTFFLSFFLLRFGAVVLNDRNPRFA
jgi:hypothetical protein